VGGTKTPLGAAAKQKTTAPPGAGLFAFAVLESEAAEKGLTTTTQLTRNLGSPPKLRPCGTHDSGAKPRSL
jgi:hypothetical protein